MNDAFIKRLAPAVRDRFHSIPDSHFDDVPEVIELRAELASAKKAHSVAIKEHDKIRAVIEDAGKSADTARQMLADLEAGRGYALAVVCPVAGLAGPGAARLRRQKARHP